MGALFNLLQMKIAHGKNLQSHGKNLQGLQKTPTHPQRLFRNFYARPPLDKIIQNVYKAILE